MAKIDYSKLHAPKAPSPHGHSKKGSFFLQHTKKPLDDISNIIRFSHLVRKGLSLVQMKVLKLKIVKSNP